MKILLGILSIIFSVYSYDCYVFIGHSNMMGYAAKTDPFVDSNCYVYSYKDKLKIAKDPISPSNNNSGSPVLIFLKKFHNKYPDKKLIAIKVCQAGLPMRDHFIKNKTKFRELCSTIAECKKETNCNIKAIICMFGWIEVENDTLAQYFYNDLNTVITDIRYEINDSLVPVILCRYELFSDSSGYKINRNRQDVLIGEIERCQNIKNLFLAPFNAIPKKYYGDDHHYNEIGYDLLVNDIIIQLENYYK